MARTFVSASSQFLTAGASLPVTATPLSIGAWIKPGAASAFRTIVALGSSSAGVPHYFDLYHAVVSSEQVRFEQYDGTTAGRAVTTAAVTGGVWQHVLGVMASNSSRACYLNGGNKGTDTTTVGSPTLNVFEIGSLSFGGPRQDYYNGDIAEVAIWNAALSDGEAVALAAGCSPLLIRPTSLRFYAPLLGAYPAEIDLMGGLALTVSGPTAAPHCRIYVPSPFQASPKTNTVYHLTGVTKSSTGAALGSVTVKLYRTSDDALIATTTSDGSGNYSFTLSNTTTQYYVVAYKAGSPDVAGTTVNTLVGA